MSLTLQLRTLYFKKNLFFFSRKALIWAYYFYKKERNE